MFYEQSDFLSPKAFKQLLAAAQSSEFNDVANPIDGIVYPLISLDIPDLVRKEIEFLTKTPVKMLFMRRSPKGVHCPNPYHHDGSHGRTSFMLYLNESEGSGTAFVRHRPTGAAYAPEIESIAQHLRDDTALFNAWELVGFCEAKPNKACMFNAELLHAAYPLGGHGEGEGARCVLTAFFD